MGKEASYKEVMTSENDHASRLSSTKQWFRKVLQNITVEPLMFLCVASAVFKFVVLPQFLLVTLCHREYAASVCNNIGLPENTAKQTQIQAGAAKWMLGFYSSSLFISLFTVPLLGSLADVVGKKRVLYIPVLFYTVQSIVYSVLSYKTSTLHPAFLIICSVLGGLSGDIVALTMLTCSYLSDITTEEQRTFRLTLLDGILNLSLCIFIFSSGYIILAVGYSHVFLVSVGIDVLALICLTFFVPSDAVSFKKKPQAPVTKQSIEIVNGETDQSGISESNVSGDVINCNELTANGHQGNESHNFDSLDLDRPVEDPEEETRDIETRDKIECYREETEAKRDETVAEPDTLHSTNNKSFCVKTLLEECNPIRRFISLGRLLKEQGHATSVVILLIILGSASMCIVGESLTLVLYIKNHPFNMNAVNVGYLLSLQGLLRFVGGYTLLNIVFQRLLKWQDINVVSVSFAFNLIYFILLGIANTREMLYGIQVLSIFGPLAGPTLRSVISKKGDSKSYATILSIALTIDALSSFVVNLLVNSTYAAMAKLYPGTFCFVLAGIAAIGGFTSYVVRRYDDTPPIDATQEDGCMKAQLEIKN